MSFITGTVKNIKKQSISLTAGPIGFEIMVPNGSQFKMNEQNTVYLSMHWNADQGPSFYGFKTELEKRVFILITSCSGIGPRIGLAVLADLGAERFLGAIQTGNEKALSNVSGIGAKKAEQMIVHLRHKVAELIASGVSLRGAQSIAHWHTVSEALLALNYTRTEINRAISYLRESAEQKSFDQLMRQALSFLSKQS